MQYYQVLKNRRIALQLSISEVASQMRLPIDGLMAIENHNLAYFGNDLVYARQLIQQYCIAIGVNWNVFSHEIDHDLKTWFDLESTAYVTNHVQNSCPSRKYKVQKKPQKPKRKTRSRLTGFSLKLSLSLFLIVGLGGILLGNYMLQKAAEYNNQQAALEKQALQAQKEAETQALANQLKEQENKNTIKPSVEIVPGEIPGEYTLYNAYGENVVLDFSFQLMQPAAVLISNGSETLFESRGEMQISTSYTSVKEAELQITIDPYTYGDILAVNGINIELSDLYDSPALITLHIAGAYEAVPVEPTEPESYIDEYGNEILIETEPDPAVEEDGLYPESEAEEDPIYSQEYYE